MFSHRLTRSWYTYSMKNWFSYIKSKFKIYTTVTFDKSVFLTHSTFLEHPISFNILYLDLSVFTLFLFYRINTLSQHIMKYYSNVTSPLCLHNIAFYSLISCYRIKSLSQHMMEDCTKTFYDFGAYCVNNVLRIKSSKHAVLIAALHLVPRFKGYFGGMNEYIVVDELRITSSLWIE